MRPIVTLPGGAQNPPMDAALIWRRRNPRIRDNATVAES